MEAKKNKCKFLGMRFLKKIREDLNLSQYKMAQLLEMIPNSYRQLENSAVGCKLSTLSLIRKKTKKTWDQLGKMIDDEVDLLKREKRVRNGKEEDN